MKLAMQFDRIRLMEHLALESRLSLPEICEAMRRRFGWPEFAFDSENETEWGVVEHEGIEYNVSRPFSRGTLRKWDNTVPVGCDIGVTFALSQDFPPDRDSAWSAFEFAPSFGQQLADLLGRRVCHHRSWHGVGKNVRRNGVFEPTAGRK